MPSWYSDPHWAIAIILVVVGFTLLIKGADWLVEGAVACARRFHLSPAVIGATVVAFGTSLPELIVSVGSSYKAYLAGMGAESGGPADIAVANIVGSNIFNIGAILGFTALISPMRVARGTLRNDYPLMLLVFVGFILFSLPWGGEAMITRWEGAVLVVGLVVFTVMCIKFGKVDVDEIPKVEGIGMGVASLFILLGIVFLPLGGEIALTGGIKLAEDVGLSNRVIGLTVMAMGTSLPELMTSIQAARRGHAEMAVGNVVGSNLFNVLCIIGISSLIFPLPVAEDVITWDFLWMMGFAVVLLPMLLNKGGITRLSGAILSAGLIVFVTLALAVTNQRPPALPTADAASDADAGAAGESPADEAAAGETATGN